MKLRWWLIGYGMAMLLVLAAPFASSNPDGLEHVAEEKGFASDAEEAPYTVIADYLFPGVESEALATMLAGWIGVTVLFVVLVGGAHIARINDKRRAGTKAG